MTIAARRRPSRATVAEFGPYALLTVLTAICAYPQVFTAFFFGDDEGYVMLSLQQFASGRPLYDDVFSQYGPFLYELYGAALNLAGLPFTTNTGRWITWLLWIVTALGYGLLTRRLTGNRWLGLLAQLVAFPILVLNAYEPMHPTGLTSLLVLCVLALIVVGETGRKTAIWAGALIAAIALIKINVGILAALGIVVAAALTLPRSHVRLWRALALAIAVLGPVLLMNANLDISFYREFAFLMVASLVIAVLRAVRFRDPGGDASASAGGFILWLCAGAASSAIAICLVIVALGTSVNALIHGVLLDPMNHPAAVISSPPIVGASLWLSGAALVAMALAPLIASSNFWRALVSSRGEPLVRHSLAWRGSARIAAAIITVICVIRIGGPSLAITLPLVLAWLAVTPPPEFEEPLGRRFARASIVFVAIFEMLQAYPVPGGQLKAGMATFVLVAALLAADGLRFIALWRKTTESVPSRLTRPAALAAGAALAIFIAVSAIAGPADKARYRFQSDPALALSGASKVHLARAQAETLESVVHAIDDQGCKTLITTPGMNSFHLWSGVAPPTGENLTPWFIVLDSKRQQSVVNAIRGRDQLCILRNDEMIDFWIGLSKDRTVEDRPLWRYLEQLPVKDTFVSEDAIYGKYRLQVPAG